MPRPRVIALRGVEGGGGRVDVPGFVLLDERWKRSWLGGKGGRKGGDGR